MRGADISPISFILPSFAPKFSAGKRERERDLDTRQPLGSNKFKTYFMRCF